MKINSNIYLQVIKAYLGLEFGVMTIVCYLFLFIVNLKFWEYIKFICQFTTVNVKWIGDGEMLNTDRCKPKKIPFIIICVNQSIETWKWKGGGNEILSNNDFVR
jgi:hypothetical protein